MTRGDQPFTETERKLDELRHAGHVAQQYMPQLLQLANKMGTLVRAQQMETEQQLQSTLNQASGAIADAQSLDVIAGLVQGLGERLEAGQSLQKNEAQILQVLEKLKSKIGETQSTTDMQVARSLQQAVSSLAQAQAAMFQSQSYKELDKLVKQLEQDLGTRGIRLGDVH